MHATQSPDRAAPRGARLLLAGGLILLAAAGRASGTTRPTAPDELRRLAEGYLKNRAAFRSLRCEFRYRVGAARDVDDALKNGPTIKPLTASCTWLLDGESICYSRQIDPNARAALEKAKANPKPLVVKGQPGFIAEIPLSARGYLTDGTRALTYDPAFVANLMGPNRITELIDSLSPDTTPWALGGLGRTMRSNPGRWILDGKLGTWRRVGDERAGSGRRIVVECKRASSRTTYWFDPARGFLPVRREWRFRDGRMGRIAITDVRKCSGGRWFPARVVSIDTRPGGAVWRVQEIALTALDAESKVKAEDMSLLLRRGIQVLHVENMLSAFRLPEAERVGIGDLKALHARCDEVAERRLRRRAEAGRR